MHQKNPHGRSSGATMNAAFAVDANGNYGNDQDVGRNDGKHLVSREGVVLHA